MLKLYKMHKTPNEKPSNHNYDMLYIHETEILEIKGLNGQTGCNMKRMPYLIARANNLHACKKSYNSFSTSNITLKVSQDNIK